MRMHNRLMIGSATVFAVAATTAATFAPTYAIASDRDDHRVKQIQIRDDCDPDTFNAAGLGKICIGDGDTTFQQFARQLMTLGRAPKWRFSPDKVHIELGDSFKATNRGGELHSFTEVKQFGASVIPQVNDLLGQHGAQPNQECATAVGKVPMTNPGTNNPEATTFTFPGQSFTDTPAEPGTELYQCCIHPWMQAVITIRQDRDRDAR
jgi:plastocyanin